MFLSRSKVLALSSLIFIFSGTSAFAISFEKMMSMAEHGDFTAVIEEVQNASIVDRSILTSSEDSNGDTLGHVVARNPQNRPGSMNALAAILAKEKFISNVLDKQNKNGNTILHELAMKANSQEEIVQIEAWIQKLGVVSKSLILDLANSEGKTLKTLMGELKERVSRNTQSNGGLTSSARMPKPAAAKPTSDQETELLQIAEQAQSLSELDEVTRRIVTRQMKEMEELSQLKLEIARRAEDYKEAKRKKDEALIRLQNHLNKQ